MKAVGKIDSDQKVTKYFTYYETSKNFETIPRKNLHCVDQNLMAYALCNKVTHNFFDRSI